MGRDRSKGFFQGTEVRNFRRFRRGHVLVRVSIRVSGDTYKYMSPQEGVMAFRRIEDVAAVAVRGGKGGKPRLGRHRPARLRRACAPRLDHPPDGPGVERVKGIEPSS